MRKRQKNIQINRGYKKKRKKKTNPPNNKQYTSNECISGFISKYLYIFLIILLKFVSFDINLKTELESLNIYYIYNHSRGHAYINMMQVSVEMSTNNV